MNTPKSMEKIKEVIRVYNANRSVKQTVRQCKVARNTVRRYLSVFKRSRLSVEDLDQMDVSKFEALFYNKTGQEEQDRERAFRDQLAYFLRELRRVGVTRQLLWEEYRRKHPDGYGRSQFCERIRREIGRRDLTLALQHPPGKVMQVDFAGKKLPWVDPITAEVHYTEVLVAVLPHSQYTFVIALRSQKTVDFVHGLNQALLFFGGCPQVLLSDNLRAYVKRANKYEPKFSDLCEQLAGHFDLELQATRVAKPKDKASVENAVSLAYKRIYAPLRNEEFYSLEELNAAILQQLEQHNRLPFQKKDGSRYSVFMEYEAPVLRPLHASLFEIKKMTRAKVQRNYHIQLGEEGNFYSVPYQYVGKDTNVVYTKAVVEIFIGNDRIAFHERLYPGRRNRYQTQEGHEPASHREWRRSQGYDAAYFIRKATEIGPNTKWAIHYIIQSRIKQSQAFNACKGVLRLAAHYSKERLEAAIIRCRPLGKVSYTMLSNILKRKLDQVEDSPKQLSIPLHKNLRGPNNYQ